jgi:hypothetical protein
MTAPDAITRLMTTTSRRLPGPRWVALGRSLLLGLILLGAGSRVSGAEEQTFASVPAWVGPVENTQSIAVGDIDGDGKLDLVRGNRRQQVTVYPNTGITLATSPERSGGEEGTQAIALGDIDGDGDLDLIRGNYDLGATLYLGDGRDFASDTSWSAGGYDILSVALGDVDGEGHLELLCGTN